MKSKSSNLYIQVGIAIAGIIALSLIAFRYVNANSDPTKQDAVQSVSANNITASLISVEASATQVKSEICIDLPNNGDWLPYASIEIKGESFPADGVTLQNAKDPNTYKNSYRCYEFSFSVSVPSDTTELKINIEKLQINLSESLTTEMCAEAERKIQATYSDFSFSCEFGNHGIGFNILEKPQEMTEDQANQLIFEALTERIEGPWEFTYALQ
ncbi:MAG: hypothetical protein IT311_03670 [Anaerolineales bacterium]|nr:hypothetical protein [Anaerolineales bacterium]MCZ2121403.1 hypothetical protein [Anaerolineales bacterium]